MWTRKRAFNELGILVLCSGIYPDWTGGAEIHIFELCRKLVERGDRVFVMCPARKLSSRSYGTNNPFIRINVKLWSTPFTALSYAVKCFAQGFSLRRQIKIVHAQMAVNPQMATAFLFALISRKPYIVACQGSDIRMANRNFLLKIFQIPFLYNAKRIFAVSNEIAELLVQKYRIPKRKVLVIGNAYNDAFTQELRKTRIRASNERAAKIVCVASMWPEKDHMTLLKGFMNASRSVDNVQLLLVGEGPLRGHLEEFCMQHDLHNVKFLGGLPHEDALEQIADCDVSILTSTEEGMPTVILEALALEKPVIATAVGGIPELVKDGVNGILIPPRSPEHVAKALERLLTDSSLRRKLGAAGAESVKDFAWTKIAEKYEIAYQEVVNEKARGTFRIPKKLVV